MKLSKKILVLFLLGVALFALNYISNKTTSNQTSDWKTYTNAKFKYTVKYPPNFQASEDNETTSFLLSKQYSKNRGPYNYIYINVIDPLPIPSPVGGASSSLYGFLEAKRLLLGMNVGETKVVKAYHNLPSDNYRYTRLPDKTVDGLKTRVYINKNPMNTSKGTKAYRYFIEKNETFPIEIAGLINSSSELEDYIPESIFNQIVSTFKFTD